MLCDAVIVQRLHTRWDQNGATIPFGKAVVPKDPELSEPETKLGLSASIPFDEMKTWVY